MKRTLLPLSIAALYLAAHAVGAQSQVRHLTPDGYVQPARARQALNHSDLKMLWRDLRAASTMEEAREPATRFGDFPWVFRGSVKLPGEDSYTDAQVMIFVVRRSVEGVLLGDEAIIVDWEIQAPVGAAGRRQTVIRPEVK